MKKDIQTFIDENREVLTDHIRYFVPKNYIIDDDEIEEWIFNDAYLYAWALGEGVEI